MNERILAIELKLKAIFKKNIIRRLDVIRANKLFDEWKVLTGYVSDKRPASIDVEILDEEPIWKKNNYGNIQTN
jgi:hypothetical protein